MSRILSASYTNKVVLITGASGGIGRETAIQFSKLGAHLCINGRNSERLEQTLKECQEQRSSDKQKVIMYVGDLRQENTVKELIQKTLSEYNRLDVLVNSAGIVELGSIESTSLRQYDRIMNLNLRVIYHLTMLAVPHLVETKGNIVNVSSTNSTLGFPAVLAYNISKAGLDHLTRCTALELSPKGVRVNSVNPGLVDTNTRKSCGLNDEQYQKFLVHSETTRALGRVGDTVKIAAAITYLASDLAASITGTLLPVDSGRRMCSRR